MSRSNVGSTRRDWTNASRLARRCWWGGNRHPAHPLERFSHETRECYRFEPPKIRVEHHIRWTSVCEQRHEDVITAPGPPTVCCSERRRQDEMPKLLHGAEKEVFGNQAFWSEAHRQGATVDGGTATVCAGLTAFAPP